MALPRLLTRRANFAAGLVIVLVALVSLGFIGLKVTDKPRFCGSCHNMEPYYASWKASAHNKVVCMECHAGRRLVDHVRLKMTDGLHTLVNYATDTYGPKPGGEVNEKVCLSEGCHRTEELSTATLGKGNISFDHRDHIGKRARIGELNCLNCHSGVTSNEHISTGVTACFICHFHQRGPEEQVAQCLRCHPKPPEEVTHEGVKFKHGEHVRKGPENCLACHSNVTRDEGKVQGQRCLSCHASPEYLARSGDKELMHRVHIAEKKRAECFECHSVMEHGNGASTGQLLPECSKCHGAMHTVQEKMYTGKGALDVDGKPSPMYSSMVTCTGCHTAKEMHEAGECAWSYRKANLEACGGCHGVDFGKEIVQSWQDTIRESFREVEGLLETARQEIAKLDEAKLALPDIVEAKELYRVASSNAEFVKSDSSWGVHNIEYADAVLKKTKDDMQGCLSRLQKKQE